MQHAASRHRDNLDDYRRDFTRTRVSLSWVAAVRQHVNRAAARHLLVLSLMHSRTWLIAFRIMSNRLSLDPTY
jgi:hypothetical protein